MARVMVRANRLYLDTNVLIAVVESAGHLTLLQTRTMDALAEGRVTAVTSEITLAECLVRPLAAEDQPMVATYEAMLDGSGPLSTVPIDRGVLRLAAALRAAGRMRLPDAIHVATAVAAGCDAFLTADRGIRVPTAIRLIDWQGQDSAD